MFMIEAKVAHRYVLLNYYKFEIDNLKCHPIDLLRFKAVSTRSTSIVHQALDEFLTVAHWTAALWAQILGMFN